MLNTNQNKSTYVVQHHLHLHTQKGNNAVKFLLNSTSFTGLNRFGLGCNDPHDFGKFGATASSGAEGCLAL